MYLKGCGFKNWVSRRLTKTPMPFSVFAILGLLLMVLFRIGQDQETLLFRSSSVNSVDCVFVNDLK